MGQGQAVSKAGDLTISFSQPVCLGSLDAAVIGSQNGTAAATHYSTQVLDALPGPREGTKPPLLPLLAQSKGTTQFISAPASP